MAGRYRTSRSTRSHRTTSAKHSSRGRGTNTRPGRDRRAERRKERQTATGTTDAGSAGRLAGENEAQGTPWSDQEDRPGQMPARMRSASRKAQEASDGNQEIEAATLSRGGRMPGNVAPLPKRDGETEASPHHRRQQTRSSRQRTGGHAAK